MNTLKLFGDIQTCVEGFFRLKDHKICISRCPAPSGCEKVTERLKLWTIWGKAGLGWKYIHSTTTTFWNSLICLAGKEDFSMQICVKFVFQRTGLLIILIMEIKVLRNFIAKYSDFCWNAELIVPPRGERVNIVSVNLRYSSSQNRRGITFVGRTLQNFLLIDRYLPNLPCLLYCYCSCNAYLEKFMLIFSPTGAINSRKGHQDNISTSEGEMTHWYFIIFSHFFPPSASVTRPPGVIEKCSSTSTVLFLC